MRKWVDNLITGILGGFIVLLLGCEITMMVTDKTNGLPSLFGYSFLYVETDSMVGENKDSLAVGEGIVIKRKNPDSVEVGEVITFYDNETTAKASPTHQLVTHRVMDIDRSDPNDLIYYCFGDNVNSGSNVSSTLKYPDVANIVHEEYYKGSLVAHSLGFGSFLKATQETWFMPVTVFGPLLIIAIWQGAEMLVDGHKAEKEEQAQIEALMVAAGVDPKDERIHLLYEEKFRYRIELEKESAEAKKKEKERFRKEAMKEKKRQMAALRKESGGGK